jgi:hypothetical protein
VNVKEVVHLRQPLGKVALAVGETRPPAEADILRHMFVDDFLPTYDVSDAVATVVNAQLTATWDAL